MGEIPGPDASSPPHQAARGACRWNKAHDSVTNRAEHALSKAAAGLALAIIATTTTMNDAQLLYTILRSSFVPIGPQFSGPVFFGICDALRLMQPHGWQRDRVNNALAELIADKRVRSCPVSGFGGNVKVYGLIAS